MSVTVQLGSIVLVVGNGGLSTADAKQLASLLEDVARAIESAQDVGENDD